jgi:N-acylneuraminate cytidylyltransferase
MRRVAIIPARGGSKRLPRKNILDMAGKPMLVHPAQAAKQSGLFDRVIVSTEDDEIKKIATGFDIEVMDRPDELATDAATGAEVCVHVLEQLDEKPDVFCLIYSTAVFIQSQDLIESEKMISGADVVMGVSAYPIHPYKALEQKDGFLKPVFPRENDQKSQTYPHWVASNGTFYWARTDSFLKDPTFFPDRLAGYELPPQRGVDIDTRQDYELACGLMTGKVG